MNGEQAPKTAADDIRALLHAGDLDLAPIGLGNTATRWHALVEIARENVSTARLAEAHVDGCEILREANRGHERRRMLGVWASDHPRYQLTASIARDRIVLRGSKAFCTGAGIVDDALVTASTTAGPMLLLLPTARLDDARIDTSGWRAHALRDTRTAVVDFDGIELDADAAIGEPGWYLGRVGFWQGAIGPAACWAGAAIGLVDAARACPPRDPHGRAHLGALVAAQWSLTAALTAAGAATDAAPHDAAAAHRQALIVRHIVDDRCRDIQDRFGRALGPRPLVNDAAIAERSEALTIYRRQCHAERDLETLGTLDAERG